MKKILVFLALFALLPSVFANGGGVCEEADMIIDVDMWVVGINCHHSGQIVDSVVVSVQQAGKHTVEGVVHRGNPDQCQTNEAFYLEINQEDGPEAKDDNDPCIETTRLDFLGEFNFVEGDNEIIMHTASECPPDTHANSVDVTQLCIYFEEIPGCTDPDASNYDPEATVDDGSCLYLFPPPPPFDPPNGVPEFSAPTLIIAILAAGAGLLVLRKK